jgi:hypothetical protein
MVDETPKSSGWTNAEGPHDRDFDLIHYAYPFRIAGSVFLRRFLFRLSQGLLYQGKGEMTV